MKRFFKILKKVRSIIELKETIVDLIQEVEIFTENKRVIYLVKKIKILIEDIGEL